MFSGAPVTQPVLNVAYAVNGIQFTGGAGVYTLSGSGPSVVVWAEKQGSDPSTVATELQRRYPDARVLPLRIAPEGAH